MQRVEREWQLEGLRGVACVLGWLLIEPGGLARHAGALIAVVLAPLGSGLAGLGGLAAGLGLTALLAPAFRRVDLLALA